MLLHPPLAQARVLRHLAVREIVCSPLIQQAGAGDPVAVKALMCGFWPFVRDFQVIVRVDTFFPVEPLIARYGRTATVQALRFMRQSLRQMAAEEGHHAEVWRQGAHEIGFGDGDLEHAPKIDAIERLTSFPRENSPTSDFPHLFFCHLAATEYVAEEISRFLVSQAAFLQLFPQSKRWCWGDIHLLDHHHGPSHLEIDEDLAQAFCRDPDRSDVVAHAISQSLFLFATAAHEALAVFATPSAGLQPQMAEGR